MSRVDSMALKANAASISRMHDSGRTVDPNRDISHNYRPHRGYSGSHHDGGLYAAEVGGSMHAQQVGGSMHRKKSMPRNRSKGALVRSRSLGNRTSPQVRVNATHASDALSSRPWSSLQSLILHASDALCLLLVASATVTWILQALPCKLP